MVLLLPLLPSLALLLLLHSFPLSPSPIIFTSFVPFHIFKFIPLILSLAMSPAQSYVLHLIPILTSSLLNNSIHLFPSSLLNALLCSILPSQTLSLLNHLHHSTSHLLLLILLSHSLTLIPCLQLKYLFLTTSSILYSISHH